MPSAQTLPRTIIIKPSLVEQHMHAERVHVVLGPNMNDLMHNFFVIYLKSLGESCSILETMRQISLPPNIKLVVPRTGN